MTDLPELRLSARSILRPGDQFKVKGAGSFRVTKITEAPSGAVEVHGYGGQSGRLQNRTFTPGRVVRCHSTTSDPNEVLREITHEFSESSKKRKGASR